DSTAPVVAGCPADATLECPATPVFGTPAFSDTCNTNLTVTFADEALPVSGNEVSKTKRTWTATDEHNNSTTCSQTIAVLDTTAPTVSCSALPVASADGACQAAVPNVLNHVSVSDSCSATNGVTLSQSPAAGALVGLGVHIITVTAADEAGNIATCTASFTVTDNTPPTISTCASNQSAFADGLCQAPVPDFTTNGLVASDCNGSAPLHISQTPAAGTLVGLGVTTVTLHVIDAANNESTCTARFTVTDNTPPTISTCASNQSAFADGLCQVPVPDFTTNGLVASDCNGSAPLH